MKFIQLFTIWLFFSTTIVLAQEGVHHEFKPHHTLGFMISHTQISQGIQENGDKKWLSLPSWAINYNFKFSPKWAVGLHSDIIVEDFAVEEHLKSSNGQVLERSYPIASAVMVSYKPGKYFSYMFGSGGEFAHTGNLFLFRIGAEYGYHISKDWELNANITNDLKVNAYNSWAVGLGVTKVFH
ncbi:hypothetical protein [Flavobacterium sp.]|uniref:hypothetical protein n=1 Tax=Flavobacterium sp. TaxID=239 RepID=UPI00286AC7DF|nr:hypothetical protein [Flavobacterium sp.]